ncbi:MAG: sulfite exporter TauE/SafE family protein [Clostridia bacterium]
MEINLFAYMAIVTFLSFIVKGMSGFGNSMFFGTLLGFKVDNISITPMDLMLSFPSNVIIMWKERKSIDPKVCVPLTILVILGSIPGVLWLKTGDAVTVKIIFGLLVIAIGIEMFFRERITKPQKSSKLLLGIIGLVAGFCCGMYGIGAMLAAYVGRTTKNTQEFKGNICVVFIADNIFRIIFYIYIGIITFDIFKTSLMLIPFMLLGLVFGMKLSTVIKEKTTKNIVIILLICSGLSLVLTNIAGLI